MNLRSAISAALTRPNARKFTLQSTKVMHLIESYTSECQVYSIDEAFFRVENEGDPEKLRAQILKWVGIGTSIGVAPTKTLAKAAAELAKGEPSGVFRLMPDNLHSALEKLPVEEIWGIGRKLADKLHSLGIFSALQLSHQDDLWLRRHLSVVGQRLAWELRGQSCLEFAEVAEKKKSILCSRSFTPPIETYDLLAERLSSFVASAARRLRSQESLASALEVFVTTNPHNNTPFYADRIHLTFPEPTDDTPTLITSAKRALQMLYKPNFLYKRAGTLLFDLVDKKSYQRDLFAPTPPSKQRQKLMTLVDHLNRASGKELLRFAAEGLTQKRAHPRYTSSWDGLLVIKA